MAEGWTFFLIHGSLSTHVQNVSIDKETNSSYSGLSVSQADTLMGTFTQAHYPAGVGAVPWFDCSGL